MKILAKATPNKKYCNILSIRDIVIEAHLTNNRVFYFETHTNNPDWTVQIPESLCKELFYDFEKVKTDVLF